MRDWIVIFVLYVVALGLFRFLGGFGSAGEAFRIWGELRSTIREDSSSS